VRQKTTAAVIVAAGRGQRAGCGLPKQYRQLDGEPVLRRTLQAFRAHGGIEPICVVIHPDDVDLFKRAVEGLDVSYCFGGDTRSESVRAGLAHLAGHAPDHVLIHDAARPFISPALIDRLVTALDTAPAVIPFLPQTDATFTRNGDRIVAPVDRDRLIRAQTPQAFHFAAIRDAFASETGNAAYADEASLARAAGLEVALVDGEAANIKLTFAEDFSAPSAKLPQFRFASGYDVHRLDAGEGLWLGGVWIPCPFKLVGHSDADVVLHALTDAILGAVGEGDIGQHFPPSDDRWKGAASDAFVRHAVDLASHHNARLTHADLTIICEAPRIGPYRDAMRANIADLLGLAVPAVNIKATTTEGLGFTGRREGIAAQASVTVQIDE
jgi:2-C-methyl-D-erythritol 4-phosphate cytidylyltransferase/2-C-methyl-D-erythritol 2,4-cyclodiphosphate synthase